MLTGLVGENSELVCNDGFRGKIPMFFNKFGNKKKLKKLKKRRAPDCHTKRYHKPHYHFLHISAGGLHEMRLHKMIIRKFRRRTRRRRYKLVFFFLPNYAYSRKSTNSRMGKGKGKFRRLMALLNSYRVIAAFRGIAMSRIRLFVWRVWRRYHLRLLVSKKYTRVKLNPHHMW